MGLYFRSKGKKKLFTIYFNQFIECINIGRRVFVFCFAVLAERWQSVCRTFVYVKKKMIFLYFLWNHVWSVLFCIERKKKELKNWTWVGHTHEGLLACTMHNRAVCCAPQKTYISTSRAFLSMDCISCYAMNANRWVSSFLSFLVIAPATHVHVNAMEMWMNNAKLLMDINGT